MAGKPKRMSQIKQLIRLYQGGSGIKTIARILGMSKNTVRSFDRACRYVLKNKLYTYSHFKNVLESGAAKDHQDGTSVQSSLPEHINIRGRAYYANSGATLFDKPTDGSGMA